MAHFKVHGIGPNPEMKMSYLRCAILLLASLALSAAEVPTGQDTAEGVACDLAKAFITADKTILNRIVMPSGKAEYQAFLSDIARQMDEQSAVKASDRNGPKDIGVCFKMGALSKDGPNSYSYAAYHSTYLFPVLATSDIR